MQSWRRARLTDFESHTQLRGLAVAEVLLDLHAQPIQGHDFLGTIAAKLRRVREQLARMERRVIELSKELDEQRKSMEPER